jgi:hypothetical protein
MAYSGLADGYVPSVKFDLTYFDAMAAFCCGVCILQDGSSLRRLGFVLPFVGWAVVYLAWGLVVSRDPDPDIPIVINRLIVIPLIAGSVALVLSSRERLFRLSEIVQLVAVLNCVVCVLQALDSSYVISTVRPGLALTDGDILFINFRPVGLWANQNQAARFFVFAVLLSFWSRPWIAWGARIACTIGVYLTASRFGAYALAFNLLAIAAFMMFTGRARVLTRTLVVMTAMSGVLLVSAWVYGSSSLRDAFAGSYALADGTISRWTRLADVEDVYANPAVSHATLTLQALERAAGGPWYGTGIFTFQRAEEGMLSGAHNIYIAVWGETGLWGLLAYPLLLIIGVTRVVKAGLRADDRFMLLLMWVTWFAAGFVSHVDLGTATAYMLWGLLYTIPPLLAAESQLAATPIWRMPSHRNGKVSASWGGHAATRASR